MTRQKSTRGVSVVEVMIGLVIFSIIFVFIFHTLTLFFGSQTLTLESTQALYLAEEGQEAVRYLRDEDWNALSALSKDTEYTLAIATTTIDAVAGTTLIDGKYTRSFFLHDAHRNSDDDFVASTTSGASVDSGSLLVTVRVTWGEDEQVQLYSLLTNLHDI